MQRETSSTDSRLHFSNFSHLFLSPPSLLFLFLIASLGTSQNPALRNLVCSFFPPSLPFCWKPRERNLLFPYFKLPPLFLVLLDSRGDFLRASKQQKKRRRMTEEEALSLFRPTLYFCGRLHSNKFHVGISRGKTSP